MSAAKRRIRREAKRVATELLKSGVPISAIGRLATNERYRRVLDKIVDATEKRLDTGEGPVTVREGLAAIKASREIDKDQRELMESEATAQETAAADAEDAKAEAAFALDVESREGDGESGTGVTPVALGAQDAPDASTLAMPPTG